MWEARSVVCAGWSGRPEEWSEGAETVLTVNVWSERVFFFCYIYSPKLSRFHITSFLASTNCLSSFVCSVTYSSVF